MKFLTIAGALSLTVLCTAANAAASDDIAVYATAKSQGSVSVGGKDIYTKTFDVSVAKLPGDTVDLSKFCLKAYSPDNKVFKLDTVDEKLSRGVLKAGKPVKGIAVFASETDAVYQAALVKISDDCK